MLLYLKKKKKYLYFKKNCFESYANNIIFNNVKLINKKKNFVKVTSWQVGANFLNFNTFKKVEKSAFSLTSKGYNADNSEKLKIFFIVVKSIKKNYFF